MSSHKKSQIWERTGHTMGDKTKDFFGENKSILGNNKMIFNTIQGDFLGQKKSKNVEITK